MTWEDYKKEMKERWMFIGIVIALFALIALILAMLGVEPPN
ncbi:MAG: hypothetical protein ABIF82_05390 [Planctomycetota bacterium]